MSTEIQFVVAMGLVGLCAAYMVRYSVRRVRRLRQAPRLPGRCAGCPAGCHAEETVGGTPRDREAAQGGTRAGAGL